VDLKALELKSIQPVSRAHISICIIDLRFNDESNLVYLSTTQDIRVRYINLITSLSLTELPQFADLICNVRSFPRNADYTYVCH
jgi:hypothetical protein